MFPCISFEKSPYNKGLFAKVRDMCNITPDEYARSFEATCKETFSEGRSGAFMFFSSDQRCIAKSTPKHELLSLQKLMPAYVDYLLHNPTSLITRFLGAHCITMYGVELHFVVMLNCFPSHRLSERYDLKGSWVNRHALTKGTPQFFVCVFYFGFSFEELMCSVYRISYTMFRNSALNVPNTYFFPMVFIHTFMTCAYSDESSEQQTDPADGEQSYVVPGQ